MQAIQSFNTKLLLVYIQILLQHISLKKIKEAAIAKDVERIALQND